MRYQRFKLRVKDDEKGKTDVVELKGDELAWFLLGTGLRITEIEVIE